MLRTYRSIYALASVLVVATVACSSSSSSSAGGTGGAAVAGTVKDFSITVDPSRLVAGEVNFTITNDGPSTHEFVVVQTDTAPGDLPVENDEVNEDGIALIGEVEDIAPSTTADLTLTLEAGQYVILCNITAHYQQGMHTGLTVT